MLNYFQRKYLFIFYLNSRSYSSILLTTSLYNIKQILLLSDEREDEVEIGFKCSSRVRYACSSLLGMY